MTKKKWAAIAAVLALGIFGYSQYASASQVEVSIARSELLSEDDGGSDYRVELLIENPSLMMMTAGETEFFVMNGAGQIVGVGQLEPFTLQPMDHSYVGGTFHTDPAGGDGGDQAREVRKITGVTTYNVLFASIDVPFVYYPTEEQTMEFIRQG